MDTYVYLCAHATTMEQLTSAQVDALVELKHIEQHVMFTSTQGGSSSATGSGSGGETTVHNRCGFLHGPSGSGKTTVLTHLIHGEFSKWSLDKTAVTKDGSMMVVKTVPLDRMRFFTLVVTPCPSKWTRAFDPDEYVVCATSDRLEKALSDGETDVGCKLVLIKPPALWRASKNPRSNLHTTRILRVIYDRANDIVCAPVLDANFIWYLDSREDDHGPRLSSNLFDKQVYSVDEILSWTPQDWRCVSCDRSCTARSVRSSNTVALSSPPISFDETFHTAYVYMAESSRDTLLGVIRNGDIGTACNMCGIPARQRDASGGETPAEECPIGYHEIDVAVTLPCEHSFEFENLVTWALSTSEEEVTGASCPLCRQVSHTVEWSVTTRDPIHVLPNVVDCIAQIYCENPVGSAMVVVTHDTRMQNTLAVGLRHRRIPCDVDHSLRPERPRDVEPAHGRGGDADPPIQIFQVHRGENVGTFLFSAFDVVVLVGDIPDALGKKIVRRCARYNAFVGKARLQAHRIRVPSSS